MKDQIIIAKINGEFFIKADSLISWFRDLKGDSAAFGEFAAVSVEGMVKRTDNPDRIMSEDEYLKERGRIDDLR